MFIKLTVDICARNGIALVIVPENPGTRAAGATKWLSQHKAMVMLSGRYKTDDQLWFTFFHELCHVMRHSKRSVWIEADDGREDPCEAEADEFARDLLIPPDAAKRLPRLRKLDDIRRFAEEIGIAPGIVVARMQREGLLNYRTGNKLKQSIGLPGA